MPASAIISAGMSMEVPAPVGTVNALRQQLIADATIVAGTDTIAQLSIFPDDAITGDDQHYDIELLAAALSCTGDSATDKITAAAHGLPDGTAIQFGGTTLPAPLVAGTTYYVRDTATNDFKVAATVGGAAIDLTTNGTAVTVRVFDRATIGYSYPSIGPAVPVQIREKVNGTPDDFTRIRALQVVLRPLDTAADALGTLQLTAGDPTDRFGHFNLPLHLDFSASGDETWPSWTAALPEGFIYDTDFHLILRVKSDESNVNLLILINLLGN